MTYSWWIPALAVSVDLDWGFPGAGKSQNFQLLVIDHLKA
jgi:hypothetical protein